MSLLSGVVFGTYENGQIGFESEYHIGVKHGLYRVWYKNGQLKEKKTFNYGNLNEIYRE